MTVPLKEALQAHLQDWQNDLAEAWREPLAGVELDWDAVTPAARLEGTDRIIPLRKGHGDPAVPPGSHVLRAFDHVAPQDVRAVLLGQDPYPAPSRATGLSFEPGDLAQWTADSKTPRSLKRVVPVLAQHRRPGQPSPGLDDDAWGHWTAALAADPGWIGSPPALFAHWRAAGVLCLNIGLTLSRFDNANKPPRQPPIQPMHMALWTPLVHRVLQVLAARADKPLLLMLWGEKAQDAVDTAALPPAPGRVIRVDHRHPSAPPPDEGGLPPFADAKNPFTRANTLLRAAGRDPIDW